MKHRPGLERSQTLLFPERLEEYVAVENPVRFLDAFIAQQDLATLGFAKARCAATGRPPYDPAVLLKLYLYGYLHRLRSSRRLEAECQRNVELIWLTGKLAPDFKTIADFRKDNLKPLKALARQFTLLCRQLDLFGGELLAHTEARIAVANVMRLTYELGGRVWNAVPACLRDPFIDFFSPLILRQIPFFQELVANSEAWRQTRPEIMILIRQIFRDFDLPGALWSAFRIVIRAMRIPVDLFQQLLDKAAQAMDAVIAAPLRFIENALRVILSGIGKFMLNILSHLWYGVQGWLFNAVSVHGISPPSSWTDLRAVFGFVLDALGISVDHVIDLIDRRVLGVGRRLRQAARILTGVWEWVSVAINEGVPGIWRMVVDRLSSLGRTVLESAVSWVMTRIIAIVSARLTALAASAGLSGVLEAVVAVYQAVRTAAEYARRILQILIKAFDTVLEIAQGTIGPAAEMVEQGLRMAMPVVIGFLAN